MAITHPWALPASHQPPGRTLSPPPLPLLLQPISRLVSPHKSPVLSTTVLAARGCQWEQVVVAHQSGNLTLYEPFSRVPTGDVAPKLDLKMHDKDIVGVCLVATNEDPENMSRAIFTAGEGGTKG